LKDRIISFLQRVLGFGNYLFLFSWYKILTLKKDTRENDFFYFVNQMNENDTVLDIGANIGFMSYFLAKKVNQGKVYSFEPIPENINTVLRIKKFFKLDNVQVQDYALGDETKMLTMIMPLIGKAKKQGLSHVVEENSLEKGLQFSVEQNRLDDINLLKDQKIQGIKIDVENFEFQVFKGAIELLRNNKPIIYCELWDNENRTKCFNLLGDLGYQTMVLIDGKLQSHNPANQTTQNFFFVPN
jgi:FkbM family methyltransferase